MRVLTGGVEFVRVVRGRYVEACWADDLRTRCAAVCDAVPAGVVSHWTALQLAGLPVPTAEEDRIHLTVPTATRCRLDGIIVHRSAAPALPRPGELPVSGPGWAWCDVAATVTAPVTPSPSATSALADLLAALDALLRADPGVEAPVRALLASRRGRRGTALALEALRLRDPRAESPMESRLRLLLVLAGLAPEAVQHRVTDRRGCVVARVDLAYPSRRVVVEFEGDHHRDRRQWRQDLSRRRRLETLGWRVVEVTGADLLSSPRQVVGWVREALERPRVA